MSALMSDETIVGIDGNIAQLNVKNWCFTGRLVQIYPLLSCGCHLTAPTVNQRSANALRILDGLVSCAACLSTATVTDVV